MITVGGAAALGACASHGSDPGKATAVVPSSPSSQSPGGATTPSPTDRVAADTQAREDAKAAEHASDAKIVITPKSGSTGAAVRGAAQVHVTGGTLTAVTMTAQPSGAQVAGVMSADKTTWTPSGTLARGTQYKVTAHATEPPRAAAKG